MLVLTRREREQILIGRDVVVSVERIDAGKVRIGIQAPESVVIVRAEIAKREPKKCR